ncbi:hypothetical protein RUND412_001662 [Rhizina undulata]
MKCSLLFLLPALLSVANAKLLLDYKGGDKASVLGNVELEGQELHDHIKDGGKNVYIKPGNDPEANLPALHYHREAHFRRAEVKALTDKIEEGKTYYIGYHLRVPKTRNSLVLFQWKKADKAAEPVQNIPLNLEFDENLKLKLDYTIPGGSRDPYATVEFAAGKPHHIGLAINTADDGTGWVEFYLDGVQQKFKDGKKRLENIRVFTGPTSPKFGLYRGEKAAKGDSSPDKDHVFDSYVYRVMISDKSFDEVAEAAGV